MLPEGLVSLKLQDRPSTEATATSPTADEYEGRPHGAELSQPPIAPVEALLQDVLRPPTPGLDDTPYIRFAIDQLTRDEELTGRRRDGSGESEASFPVERIVPDEGLGYYTREARPPPRKEPPSDRSTENVVVRGQSEM